MGCSGDKKNAISYDVMKRGVPSPPKAKTKHYLATHDLIKTSSTRLQELQTNGRSAFAISTKSPLARDVMNIWPFLVKLCRFIGEKPPFIVAQCCEMDISFIHVLLIANTIFLNQLLIVMLVDRF